MVRIAKFQARHVKDISRPLTLDEIHSLNQTMRKPIRVVQGYKRARDISRSFMIKFPRVAVFWDFEKNSIDPYTVYPNSELYAWWTCPSYKHSIRIKVRSRMKHGEKCSVCVKMSTPIQGSLKEMYPDIAKDWDYEKNAPLIPEAIKPRARNPVYWLCPEHRHSYKASPDNRVGNASRCPYCYGSGGVKRKGERRIRRI